MPYTLSESTESGKKKFCMTSKKTNRRYCYDSKEARAKAMKLHEAFSHGFELKKG